LELLAGMFGNDKHIHTQDAAFPITAEGDFIMTETMPGGHGSLINLWTGELELIQSSIAANKIVRHVQGDDLGDDFNGVAMARKILSGETVMVILTAPNNVSITNAVKDIAGLVAGGKVVEIEGKKATSIDTDNELIHLEDGSTLNIKEVMTKLEQKKVRVQMMIKDAETKTGQDQRNALIDTMEFFQTEIYETALELQFQVEGEEKPRVLIEVSGRKGGHWVEIGGDTIAVEQSEYAAGVADPVTWRKVTAEGQETEHHFPRDVVQAVTFKFFNTNNFGVDPLAIAANRSRRVKTIYHEFLLRANDIASRSNNRREIDQQHRELRAEYEKKASEALATITPAEWQARNMLLEQLMLAIYPPPVEFKQGKIKLNMMAQSVTSFEAVLAYTNIVADDISLENLDDVIEILSLVKLPDNFESLGGSQRAQALKRQAEIRAQLKLQHLRTTGDQPMVLKPSSKLMAALGGGDLKDARRIKQLIEVPDRDFTQVKDPPHWPELVRVANELFDGSFRNLEIVQYQAAAADQWAEQMSEPQAGDEPGLKRLGLIGADLEHAFREALWDILEHGTSLPEDQTDQHSGHAKKIELLEKVRKLVDEGRFDLISQWNAQFRESDKEFSDLFNVPSIEVESGQNKSLQNTLGMATLLFGFLSAAGGILMFLMHIGSEMPFLFSFVLLVAFLAATPFLLQFVFIFLAQFQMFSVRGPLDELVGVNYKITTEFGVPAKAVNGELFVNVELMSRLPRWMRSWILKHEINHLSFPNKTEFQVAMMDFEVLFNMVLRSGESSTSRYLRDYQVGLEAGARDADLVTVLDIGGAKQSDILASINSGAPVTPQDVAAMIKPGESSLATQSSAIYLQGYRQGFQQKSSENQPFKPAPHPLSLIKQRLYAAKLTRRSS